METGPDEVLQGDDPDVARVAGVFLGTTGRQCLEESVKTMAGRARPWNAGRTAR